MKIHINSKQGIYEVVTYGRNSITLSTKHNTFQVPTSDFKTFAGGIWNHSINIFVWICIFFKFIPLV